MRGAGDHIALSGEIGVSKRETSQDVYTVIYLRPEGVNES